MAGVPPDYFQRGGPVVGQSGLRLEHPAPQSRGFDQALANAAQVSTTRWAAGRPLPRRFQAFWQVPYGETTAINGSWAESPGDAFFHTLEHELGHVPVWAEDLGLITPEVEKLRDDFDFPGMKVLQFAFDDTGAENPYLPINFEQNCVCYTGTHDNDTTVGWWTGLTDVQRGQVLDYAGSRDGGEINWAMIRLAMEIDRRHGRSSCCRMCWASAPRRG